MLVPSPKWLDTGNNAWQMAAATFVGLQSIPGLVILYGGYRQEEMGDQFRLHGDVRLCRGDGRVGVVGLQHGLRRHNGSRSSANPKPATLRGLHCSGQATIPAAASGMPALTFPMATLMFFQFVFAAITVIILAGSLLGRMNFNAWVDLRAAVDDLCLHGRRVQPLGWRLAGGDGRARFLRRLCDPSRRRHVGVCRGGGDRTAHPSRIAITSRPTAC